MIKDEILPFLKEGVVEIIFKKVGSGEQRIARGTLKSDFVNNGQPMDPSKTRRDNPDVVSYWDMGKQDWRSFRIDTVEEINVL